ncbi:bifunctional diaminohydroxyphosphoribosylaminopyrimidine deaminase/5-amino-6-(5-phosphoribosylamino)uracil reductase RibD [Leucobacter ruminantium]|uniref:Riboflavin biosynthesis protein RibD n=1 Tax=Leucobacter ruminantium TaxID=1289170 RepID=A0A939LY60_9MICO|nr:dihydrofolate reductase family protein [Leucobacter ruminantium]MBO1804557.1 dihydrofolate reductase family protein [Leucobacter ruminantium]
MLEQAIIEDAMRRAIALARRGPALDPNPQVGCTILDPEGRIVSEGWHRGSGTPHAEVDALSRLPEAWTSRRGELTAVVTLEPCNHTGRTGPCAVALVEFGIGAVAFGLADPGRDSSGGAETLRGAGIEVRGGVLAGEVRALNSEWLRRQEQEQRGILRLTPSAPDEGEHPQDGGGVRIRPHVTVKWAQTLDGRAAAADGSSRWITGPEARADVHRRRAEADAILVGTGTLLADDPALTARDADGGLLVPAAEQPVPVVLGHRPIPRGSRVLQHPALAARGLGEPVRLRGDDLAADLAGLAELGVRRLFVEGGPAVASSLIAAGLADEVLVYLAPALLGGPRLALGDIGVADMRGILRLRTAAVERLGDDLLVRAAVERPSLSTIPTATEEEI